MATKFDQYRTKSDYRNGPGSSTPLPQPKSAENGKKSKPPILPELIQDPVLNRLYSTGRFLGKGGFAWCYEVRDVISGDSYALKIIPKKTVKAHHRDSVLREIAIHYPLRHDHVVRLYSAFEDIENIYMILEYCQGESLVHVLKRRVLFSEAEARYYLHQLLLGVQYLHQEAFVLHRDLKLGNMLLTKDMKVKIADFGLAADMRSPTIDQLSQVCGTPNYIAPEVLNKEGHTTASEAWSIGCIMYAMLFGKPPFETASLTLTYQLILECRYSYPVTGPMVSHAARDLIQSLLNPLPHFRPTIAQIMRHPFFTAEKVLASLQLGNFDEEAAATSAPTPSTSAAGDTGSVRPVTFDRAHNLPAIDESKHESCVKLSSDSDEKQSDHVQILSGPTRYCGLTVEPTPQSVSPYGNKLVRYPAPTSATAKTVQRRGPQSLVKPSVSAPAVPTSRANSASPDSGCSSVVCAIDAIGNVSFGPTQEAALTKWMRSYHKALSEIVDYTGIVYGPEAYLHGQSNLIYVTKWIDYSNRYGFGCQYNNGGVSIMHNDGTRLCLSPDRRYCRRWKGGKEYSWPTEIFDMADENWSLGESASLIRHFVGYMDSNLLAGGVSVAPVTYTSTAVPFVVMWRRFTDCIVVVLSDGTFQVNFFDHHTKVALSLVTSNSTTKSNPLVLTFIDASRISRSYSITPGIKHVVDMKLLKRIRDVLSIHILPPTDC